MLFVKTKLDVSKIHGIGLFAAQFIPKDTIIWNFNPIFDQQIKKSALKNLSISAREQFLNYAYLSPETNKYIICFDDARFMNHSSKPNVIVTYSTGSEVIKELNVAAGDIQIGEELTINYNDFISDKDIHHKDIKNR